MAELTKTFSSVGHVIVMSEHREDPYRILHDVQLLELCCRRLLPASLTDIVGYARAIHDLLGQLTGEGARVLVDYSSMPKPFYLLLLQAALTQGVAEIVLLYNEGDRSSLEWKPASVAELYAIPGLEGDAHADSDFLFSLGFDGVVAAAMEERLQPKRLFALIADPGASADSAQFSRRQNESVLATVSGVLSTGISDVCGVIGLARDLIGYSGNDGLVVLPLGPKPHALALGLLSILEPSVTYLYPYVSPHPVRRTAASSNWCVTRVRRESD